MLTFVFFMFVSNLTTREGLLRAAVPGASIPGNLRECLLGGYCAWVETRVPAGDGGEEEEEEELSQVFRAFTYPPCGQGMITITVFGKLSLCKT